MQNSLSSSSSTTHSSTTLQSQLKTLQSQISTSPKNPYPYFNLGMLYKTMKKYDKCIKCLEKAVQLMPHFVEANVNLGNVWKKVGEFGKAEECYLRVVGEEGKQKEGKDGKQKEGREVGLMNLGLLYKQMGRLEQSEQIFIGLTKSHPKVATNYNNLAVIQKNSKKYPESIQNLQKALQLNPQFSDAYYNMGLVLVLMKKYEEAEKYLQIADKMGMKEGKGEKGEKGEKGGNVVVGVVRAVNLGRLGRFQEGFQVLGRIGDVEGLDKKLNIRKSSLKWIKTSLDQLTHLSKLNQQKTVMTIQQQNRLSQINTEYFTNLSTISDFQSQPQPTPTQSSLSSSLSSSSLSSTLCSSQSVPQPPTTTDLLQKIHLLEQSLLNQSQKLQKMQQNMQQLKQDVEKLKKQFEWDQKFQKLVSGDEDGEGGRFREYWRGLYMVMCTTVQAYRAVRIGVVGGGEGMVRSKIGGFVDKIGKVLGIVQKIPMVCHFCEVLLKIGQIYLGKQSQYICNQIVSITNILHNQRQLSKSTIQTILYLSTQPQYLSLLSNPSSSPSCSPFLQKLQKLQKFTQKKQKQLLAKITKIGDGGDFGEEIDVVMGHCVQIVIRMVRDENLGEVRQAVNPILAAARIWMRELRMFKVSILGAVLQQKSNIFNIKSNLYCKIIYQQSSHQTQPTKSNSETLTLNWKQSQFTFQKLSTPSNPNHQPLPQPQPQQIIFQIYHKSLLKKDTLFGKGWILDNCQRGKSWSVDVVREGEIVGYLEVMLG